MKCSKARRLLMRFVDKELENKKLAILIEEHLNLCADCKLELNSLISTKELIAQRERLAVSEDFLDRVKGRLGPQPQIIRVSWLPEAGDLARRLIPVPIVTAMLMFALIFSRLNGLNPVDEYIFGDLSNEEMGILSGFIDNSDLLELLITANRN